MDIRYGRTAFFGSVGAQSATGDCTALVVHQPIPGVARPAPLPGMHQIVRRDRLVIPNGFVIGYPSQLCRCGFRHEQHFENLMAGIADRGVA